MREMLCSPNVWVRLTFSFEMGDGYYVEVIMNYNGIVHQGALSLISALQKGQSGASNFVSNHFMTHSSWNRWWQGVSRTIVLDLKSSTQIAQLSWLDLCLDWLNFIFFNDFISCASSFFFYSSWILLLASGSSTLGPITSMLISSIWFVLTL